MSTIILNKIDDLANVDPYYTLDLIRSWDPARELMQWSEMARGYPYTGQITFNSERDACFHPSSLHNVCDRYLYYEMIGKQGTDRLSSSLLLRFDLGTAAHVVMHYYQHTMATAKGHFYRDEYNIKSRPRAVALRLGGRPDGLMKRVVTGLEKELNLRLIWEYKTCSVKSFEERKLKGPEKKHIYQIHPYLHVMDVPIGIILYYRKDDSAMLACPVLFNAHLWDEIEARLRDILIFFEKGEVPPGKTKKGCASCGFYKECAPEALYKKLTWEVDECL